MTEPRLSVRSAKARDLAHRLARRENRTVAQIVERALQAYEAKETGREPAVEFFARMAAPSDEDDIDLEAIIQEARKPNPGIDL